MARRKPRPLPPPSRREPLRDLREDRDHNGGWDPVSRAAYLGRTNASSQVAPWVLEAIRAHDASSSDRGVVATARRVGVGVEQVRAARALLAEEADG